MRLNLVCSPQAGTERFSQRSTIKANMSDTPVPPPPSPQSPLPSQNPPSAPLTAFDIGEEFGTAKRNLPPAKIVVICIAAVAVILGIVALVQKQKPQGAGSIDFINAVDVPDQNTLLASVTVTLRNTGQKSLWIHTVKARLTTSDGKTYDDDSASGVDLDRFAQAFPVLKENTQPPLLPETKLMPGTERKGTVVVSFPVTKEAFDQRKSLELFIQPYDQALPVTLTR
jgi:hypothetical protein